MLEPPHNQLANQGLLALNPKPQTLNPKPQEFHWSGAELHLGHLAGFQRDPKPLIALRA